MVARATSAPPTRLISAPVIGFLFLVALAIAARALHLLLPVVPLAPLTLFGSMAIGLACSRLPRMQAARVSFELPLSIGMILLGVQFVPPRMARLGLAAPVWIVLHWLVIAALFHLAVRLRLLAPRRAGLLAVGMGGAGLSAVVAARRRDPEAPAETMPLAIATILLSGAAGFVVLPIVGRLLGLSAEALSRWVGICMPTTAEAVLVAADHSPDAFQLTGAWRLLVNLLQWLPVVVYLRIFTPPSAAIGLRGIVKDTVRAVPAFVWGLSLLGAFSLCGCFDQREQAALGNLTNWMFLMALAGVGFNTRPWELWRMGWRAVVPPLVIWTLGVALLLLANRWLA